MRATYLLHVKLLQLDAIPIVVASTGQWENRVFRDNLFRLLSNAIKFKGTGQDDVIAPGADAKVDVVTDC